MPASLRPEEIAAVRAPLERASTLPPRCYRESAFYELEVEHVLRKQWLSVGRVDQLAKPGDFFTIDLLGEPLILVRDKDGEIRALSNVCAHRWMPVAEGNGNRNSFQCPYHYWTYGLDGRLIGAPEMQRADGFDRSSCALPSLRVELWHGFIFVNFDPDADPLAPGLAGLLPHVEPYGLADQRSTPTLDYDCPWNWKVSVENASESYHHLGLHRDVLEDVMPATLSDIQPGRAAYSIYWNPTREGQDLPTLLTPPPGLGARQRSALQLVTIFPCTMFFMMPDHTAWLQLVPKDAGHHTLHYVPLVQPGALDDPDSEPKLEILRKTLDAVHQQDMAGCAALSRGLGSGLARPGRLSHLEETIWQFQNWLLDQIEPTQPH
jgi:phenylpropionate dioxygenase-like ring-hydroxylating dioxygenase large terminal subunit